MNQHLRVSDEDYSMVSSGEDNGDINPTTEDVKGSISAATDKVGISLLGSSELNKNSVGLCIADVILIYRMRLTLIHPS